MPKREPKPHLKKLARFLESSIEQAGLSIAEFASKAGFTSSSTLYQIIRATSELKYGTAKKLSEGLRLHCNVKISADELMAMIEPVKRAEKKPERVEVLSSRPEILAPSAVLWHLQRIAPEQRLSVWPDILKLAASDFAKTGWPQTDVAIGRKPAIDVLIGLVNNKADQHQLGSLRQFVDWMFAGSESIARAELALKGLQVIFLEKRLPYQDEPEFGALLSKLATALDFQSDIQLLVFCNLIPQDSPKTINDNNRVESN